MMEPHPVGLIDDLGLRPQGRVKQATPSSAGLPQVVLPFLTTISEQQRPADRLLGRPRRLLAAAAAAARRCCGCWTGLGLLLRRLHASDAICCCGRGGRGSDPRGSYSRGGEPDPEEEPATPTPGPPDPEEDEIPITPPGSDSGGPSTPSSHVSGNSSCTCSRCCGRGMWGPYPVATPDPSISGSDRSY